MHRSRSRNPLQARLGSYSASWTECHAAPLAMEQLEDRSMLSAVGLSEFSIDENTGEKPQSKVWEHAGQWWTALANDDGTWISRLDGTNWTQVLKVSDNSSVHADVRAQGDLTHILLFDGSSSQFATIEYSAASNTYQAWSLQPNLVNMGLPSGIETATIDIDSTGRMWVAYDQSDSIEVRYSDGDYTSWSGPITVATDISSDDISAITAMPTGQIGVFWSSQSEDRFGFRVHNDGDDPTAWSAREIPAAQSAASNMADDHLNVAVASDGTLYVAAKTSFDSSGRPKIVMLVRRPDGAWDDMYSVDTSGTRPIVLLNEEANRLIVVYTSSENGGDIRYKETSLDNISFGSRETLISSGSLNNVTSTKQNFTDNVVVLASSGGDARGVLFSFDTLVINEPPVVEAGTNRSVTIGSSIALAGTASDDGVPGPLTTSWSVVSGPGSVTFGDASSLNTSVQFGAIGEYVLRLTATDGELSASDQVTITVNSQSPLPPTTTTTSTTASFQQGVAGYQGMRDTTLRSDSANSNYGNDTEVEFDGSPEEAALLAWDLSSIAPGATVESVRMEFQVSNNSSDAYEIYAVTRAWDEATATWNQASSGQSWGTAGASGSSDHGSTVLGQFARDSNGAYQLELNAAGIAVVQGWIDNPATNHGFIIQDYENASDGAHISSSEASSATQRPRLVVTYSRTTESGQNTEVTGPEDNETPTVAAGANQSVAFGTTVNLTGTASDDGEPSPLTTSWSVVSGPGTVTFGDNSSPSTTASFSAAGTYVLRLTASDGELSASDEVTISLSQTNTPPVVEAGANQSLTLENSITLSGSASDDGLPGPLDTTWSRVSGPGTVTFGNASAVSTTASFSTAGTYVLQLTASDGQYAANDQVTITVNAPAPQPSTNEPVTVSYQQGVNGYQGMRDTTIRSDSANTNFGNDSEVEFDGSPEEAGLLAWDLSSIAPGSVVSGVTLEFQVSNKSRDAYEIYAVTRAWDEATATWNQAANGQGWGTAGASAASDHGSAVLGQFSRDSNGTYQLQLNATGVAVVQGWIDNPSSNHGFIIQDYDNASDGAHISSSEASNVNQRPKLSITYQAPSGDSGEGEVDNTAPQVEAGANQSVALGTTVSLTGTAGDDGLPSALTTSWSVVSGPGSVMFGNAASASTTASFSTAGTYVLRLTADDGELSASDEVTITLSQTNARPVVEAGANQSLTLGDPITLSGSASDDGRPGPLSTTWSSVSGPGTVTFGNASATGTTATFSTAGTYVLRLTASDGELAASDEVTITVNAPAPPVDTSQPVSVSFQQGVNGYQGMQDTTIRSDSSNSNYGNDTEVEFDGSPEEAGLLAWDLSSIAPGSVVNGVTLEFQVSNNSSDTYEIYAVTRAWDEATATWNQAAGGQSWGTAGASASSDHGSTVLGEFARDSNGSYQLELNAAGVAVVQGWIDDPSTNHGFIIQDYDDASDGAHIASSEASNINQRPKLTINYRATSSPPTPDPEETEPVNLAPTVQAGANQSGTLGSAVALAGTASDDNLPGPLTTSWSQVSGPGTVTFANAAAASTTAQFSAAGSYVLELTASDGEYTVSDQVTITVNAPTPPPSTTQPVTASFQQGVNGYQGTRDTTLRDGSQNTNYGNDDTLEMDGSPDEAALLAWDLSSIAPGSTITGVSMELTVTGNSPDTYEIYAVDRAWEELGATWNQAASGESWSGAGATGAADHGSTVLGQFLRDSNGLYELTLNDFALSVVQSWIDNPLGNHGFLFQDYDQASDGVHVVSSEGSSVTQRPKLIVSYLPA